MRSSNLHRRPATLLLLLAASTALLAQTAATPAPSSATGSAVAPAPPVTGPLHRTVIVLDPAHGGVDGGSRLTETLAEKDVTLALAFKLRSLLTSRGFTVVMTRDSDTATTPLSLDDRAGIANHQRAVACLLLHATSAGSGVHLYTSELPPAAGELALQPWLTAQGAWVGESVKLAHQIGTALDRSRILLVSSTASVRPVDSLTCPAVVVELAPNGDDPASINETAYQQKISEAIAGAMVFWQNQAQAPSRIAPPAPAGATAGTAEATP